MKIFLGVCLLSVLSACGGGSGNSTTSSASLVVDNITCSNNPTVDSTLSGNTPILNTAWDKGSPTYHSLTTRKDAAGNPVTVAYMLHPSVGTSKGLIILFVGGQGIAALTTSGGGAMSGAGLAYETRSANMFAQQGFDVATIDHPSDETSTYTYNSQYDAYRTSMRAAVDISSVINDADTSGLPVFLEGSSRGSISATSNSKLSSGIAVASPVTSGGGDPIGGAGSKPTLQAASIHIPMHVTWDTQDSCSVTVPADAQSMAQNFLNAGVNITATAIAGGLGDYPPGCSGAGYHQYFGVESCTVGSETTWAATVATSLTSSGNHRPVALAISKSTTGGAAVTIDLSSYTSDADGDTLSYALPYKITSLGGALSLTGSILTYTPPNASSYTAGTDDTFVYVVSDGKGGTANNVVTVTLH